MLQESSTVINEDQKNTNPVYKVIYNKIRNLNKKLAQIAHIETLDTRSLKPGQASKLSKKDEILAQIAKHEEFAVYYKNIVIENDLVYDKIDDMIKLATLLAVGSRIQHHQHLPDEAKPVYEKIYAQIFGKQENKQKQMADQIVRVYHLLTQYTETPEYYSQCRDYLTYLDEIDAREKSQPAKITAGQVQHSTGNVQTVKKDDHAVKNEKNVHYKEKKTGKEDSLSKTEITESQSREILVKLEQKAQIDVLPDAGDIIRQYNKELPLKKQEEKSDKQDNSSTTNPEAEKEKQQLEKQFIEATHHKDNVWSKQQLAEYDAYNRSMSQQSHQDHLNPHTNQPKPREGRRNRKNRKQRYVEAEFNVRKCSDTSLEPTPDKHKGKKMRFMEKID